MTMITNSSSVPLAPLVQGLGQNLPLLFPQQGGQGLEDLGL
jgi:hypothetical protein